MTSDPAADRPSSSATLSSSMTANPPFNFTAQDAPLLRLPAELRNQIYHHVFNETPGTDYEASIEAPILALSNWRPCIQLIKTCRQIHQEASKLFYKGYVSQNGSGRNIGKSFSQAFGRAKTYYGTIGPLLPDINAHQIMVFWPGKGATLLEAEAICNAIADQQGCSKKFDFLSHFAQHVKAAVRDAQHTGSLYQHMCCVLANENLLHPTNWKSRIGTFKVGICYGGICIPTRLYMEGPLATVDWSELEEAVERAPKLNFAVRHIVSASERVFSNAVGDEEVGKGGPLERYGHEFELD